MNKRKYILISIFPLVLTLMVLFAMRAIPVKAIESEKPIATNGISPANPKRVTCAVNYRLLHEARLQRMDFALSDGKGNALGLRSGNSIIGQDACDFNLRRLDFALSDGKGNALGLRNVAQVQVETTSDFTLQRLDFALSDGRGNALGLRNEAPLHDENVNDFTLQRLDFALSDGRGNALGLRSETSAGAVKLNEINR